VIDLDTGETLLARDARALLRPASTLKLMTTAAVCRRAPEAKLVTRLVADAVRDAEVVLIGGGDPFLTTEELAGLVRELCAAGLESCRSVRVVDPLRSAPRFGEGWMWDDEPATFMPALSGAPIDGGCVTVEVRSGSAGVEARCVPTQGSLELRVTDADDRLRVDRGRYVDSHVITVRGRPRSAGIAEERITVPDPAEHTAWVLVHLLTREGLCDAPELVTVDGAAPVAPVLSVVLERAVAAVVRDTNKPSDNLGAELLLRLLPSMATGDGPVGLDSADATRLAVERGLEIIDEDVRALGLDPDGYRIADGSGVSHYSLISAELLVATLAEMWRLEGAPRDTFVGSLPVAGEDGTLRRRMVDTPAAGRVRAKTGTISGVSNLAGYLTTTSGRHLAFAILVQNFVGSSAPWRTLQDELCATLAEL
jgi:D-alanyl-D-alanine carboxypeptidase/D-alanyl-D-alanine-endopeptidase (penicillin-binding protein 4)